MLKKYYKTKKREMSEQLQKKNEPAFPEMPQHYYFDESIFDWDMSRLSKGLTNHADPNKIIQSRRKNYMKLYEAVQVLPEMQPLYNDLPEGICPLVFPVLVSNPQEWEKALNKRDVYPFRWWKGYHPKLSWEGFPEAVHLKNHLLAFCIDQQMSDKNMDDMANSIKAVSLKMKKQ